MKKSQSSTEKKKTPDKDMMEAFNVSPWYSLGKILPTSTKQKEDVFDNFRPKRQCVDYKISETWTKIQGGDVKINVKQTSATYKEIPPEICKPQSKKKLKLFSGGPPQWKFIDEIWREHLDECQNRRRKEHVREVREAKAGRADRFKGKHEIVQRLVGPEWFMELSPKQLKVVDRFRQSVYLDLRNNTTDHCQDVLAALGLVLKPNKTHVAKALEHSCGCPVEFLLVLYQILDPKRQSYSLNDRLLLSAVVHLTLTQTLRELHVRIPSPPSVVKEVKKTKKKVKKVKYASPYLEPLTYEPPPPKYSGIYKNKHKQYPESPYFSYLPSFKLEKRFHGFCINYKMLHCNEKRKAKIKEYKDAQDFYDSLPGPKEEMPNLIFPTQLILCPNLLRPRTKPPIKQKLIAPHLCKVTASEPVICFCEENRRKQNLRFKKVKRSCCEKSAQKFLQSLCLCDDCLEGVAQKNLIRVHGGFRKSPCKCDEPVPIVQGTLLNKTCDCYKEYRNNIVGAAAQQFLVDQKFKYVVGGVIMTKFGPVYNIHTTLGEKICLCGEIRHRKMQIKQIQQTLWTNKAKFAIGGVTMSKIGPVFNLTAVIARSSCKCILNYRAKLKVLEMQNKVRKNPNSFVNHGLINGHLGPVFHFSSFVRTSSELREVCSCEIKKPKCFQRCLDFVEYKVSRHTPPSSSDDSNCISEESDSESESEVATSWEQSGGGDSVCPYCAHHLATENKTKKTERNCSARHPPQPPCADSCSSESETSTDQSDSSSSQEETTSTDQPETSTAKTSDHEDFFTPRPCRCKDELDRFMKAKCPCEECNRQIRRGYATYVMGGTKTTPSGNQINVVQGVQQPLCSCMHDHQETIRKIDEYKSRVKARYDLKKHPKKYCISGVKNTPDGPVYIISGLRPPVDCECAKASREKKEAEEFEKQRAKMPNTGRMKYEISGVKAMPEENVYILSRALNMPECKCARMLEKFERAHGNCLKEFAQYLEQTEEEIRNFDEDMLATAARRGTVLREDDIQFDPEHKSRSDENIENAVSEPMDDTTQQEEIEPSKDSPPETQEDYDKEPSVSSNKIQQSKCSCPEESSEPGDDTSSDDETSSDSESSSENDSSECGSCHVTIPPEVRPVTLPNDKSLPESFLSKRFAIFRTFPKDRKTQMQILRHILKGMAEDGFPLAKLPQVYKLPIFKLWLQLRSGVYWTYDDRLRYFGKSKNLWKHTVVCYNPPRTERMPFSLGHASKMTWNHANLIRRLAAEKMNNYYRKLNQGTVETGREFFAPTFSYEFPTPTWRDCAFAYLPTTEEDVFAYKIVQPHDTRVIPDNRKTHCYC